MKYIVMKESTDSYRIYDENNLVVELSTIKNHKLLGVLLKAVALTKKSSVVNTNGGATGFFKEGLTQYELSGAKLYADFNIDGTKVSLPYFRGMFHSVIKTKHSFMEVVKNGATFRAVI